MDEIIGLTSKASDTKVEYEAAVKFDRDLQSTENPSEKFGIYLTACSLDQNGNMCDEKSTGKVISVSKLLMTQISAMVCSEKFTADSEAEKQLFEYMDQYKLANKDIKQAK
jgi:hypothetical protein